MNSSKMQAKAINRVESAGNKFGNKGKAAKGTTIIPAVQQGDSKATMQTQIQQNFHNSQGKICPNTVKLEHTVFGKISETGKASASLAL